MRILVAGLLVLAVTGCTSPAATPPPRPADAGPPPGVATVTYDDVGHEMDVYEPSGDRPPSTMVLLVHGVGGGSSSPKDHPGLAAWGERLAAAGVVAAIPNFDAALGGSRAGRDQLAGAVAVLRDRVAGPGEEQPALVTMGFSAGGPDWVAASFDPRNQPVSALVGYYAEIEPARPSLDDRSLSGRLAVQPKPLLLAYGLQDDAPGILASLRAFRRTTGPRDGVTILTHPRAGHAFDVVDDDRRTREIIRRTVAFVAGR